MICAVVHGVHMEDEQALYSSRVLTAAEVGFSEVFRPGSFLVEFLPWLQHVPAWFPGTGWQKKLQIWRGQADAMLDDPYNVAKDAMVSVLQIFIDCIGRSEPQSETETRCRIALYAQPAFGALVGRHRQEGWGRRTRHQGDHLGSLWRYGTMPIICLDSLI